jgi:NAD(P)-dependent dehydrogenase (short-subunit alcohol dehydrogenase family)
VTVKSLPLLSVYTGSKAAVNAFTESLALELAAFDVRAHLVLPGRAPSTSFGANAKQRLQMHEAYAELTENVFAGWAQSTEALTETGDVAEAVWRAATEPGAPMRIAAGADAVALTK